MSALPARAVIAAFLVVGAVLAGFALRQAREQAAVPAADMTVGVALAPGGSSPSPASDMCDALARITPVAVPPLATADLGNGTKRITSAEGGYEIVVPSEWPVAPGVLGQAAFGQAHITSYDPKAAPTPDPERWMLPPEVGIALDIQVWANPQRESLDRYAKRVRIGSDQISSDPGIALTVGGQPAHRYTIRDEHRFQPADRPVVITKQTRIVWLIQSLRPDRVLVAYATPGESALLPEVERAVSAMRITQPVAAQPQVTVSRDEVLSKWLFDTSGATIPGRRAEAKLMTYAEAGGVFSQRDGLPNGLYRIDHDPEDLYWVVAVSGPDLPVGRGGPFGAASPPPTRWIMFYAPATGAPPGSTGMQFSSQGSWPPNFDALRDRCS